jgi:hypothetical protein
MAAHYVLTTDAQQAGRASGLVQRQSKLDGAALVQTLVFSSLSDPDATTDDLAQTAATLGVTITGSGIVQRCTHAAATCLQTVLAKAVQRVLAADPTTVPVLARFLGVYVQDSTTIVLPPELAEVLRPPPQTLSLETIALIAAIGASGASIAAAGTEIIKHLLEIKQVLIAQGQVALALVRASNRSTSALTCAASR